MDDDFREQCRRSLARSVSDRIKYGFFKQYKPILDDESRTFKTMAEYRRWAHDNLPRYLGYKIVSWEEEAKTTQIALEKREREKINDKCQIQKKR